MSPLEKVVYQVERQLNAPELKKLFPEIGEDIKVMGIRREKSIHLTIACALVDRFVHDIDDYCRQIEHLQQLARTFAQQVSDQAIAVEVNRGDDPQRGNIYLTVTGTSAEAGDDGQVGRGNRSNGLITPYRPMTLEAAAGKNPVTHVGKLYNVLARQIATAIVEEMPEIASVYCYLVSQIGRPVSEPQLIDLQIQTQADYPLEGYRPRIEELAREHLSQIGQLWQGFIRGEFSIY
jgi:S-adenosylmethionine synthetase